MRARRGGGTLGGLEKEAGLSAGGRAGGKAVANRPLSQVSPGDPSASRPRPHGPRTARMELRAPSEPSSALARAPGPGPQAHPTRTRTPAHIPHACALLHISHARALLLTSHTHAHSCSRAPICSHMHMCRHTVSQRSAHIRLTCARVCTLTRSHAHQGPHTTWVCLAQGCSHCGGWGGAAGLLSGGGGVWRPAAASSSASHPGCPVRPWRGRPGLSLCGAQAGGSGCREAQSGFSDPSSSSRTSRLVPLGPDTL